MASFPRPQINFILQEDRAQELKQLQDLLHLFHHRNKNQHRRSIWWRSFDSFRREIRSLLNEVARWTTATADLRKGTWPSGAKGVKTRMALAQKNAARKPQLELRMQQRLSWWAEHLVEKWWIAFTHILALNQFAQLGLFLVAALARCAHLTGLTAALEQLADDETEALLTRFATEETPEIFGAGETSNVEDVGEVLQRSADETPVQSQDAGTISSRAGAIDDRQLDETSPSEALSREKQSNSRKRNRNSTSSTRPPFPMKKKRGAGDAIEDLFSGILDK
ncbi:MAG: hypothetical protein M1822_010220 [Bathelium mastoideum]|nr:MAG: hypothetical protein M1822_010220 [Bathelium mastoideum]